MALEQAIEPGARECVKNIRLDIVSHEEYMQMCYYYGKNQRIREDQLYARVHNPIAVEGTRKECYEQLIRFMLRYEHTDEVFVYNVMTGKPFKRYKWQIESGREGNIIGTMAHIALINRRKLNCLQFHLKKEHKRLAGDHASIGFTEKDGRIISHEIYAPPELRELFTAETEGKGIINGLWVPDGWYTTSSQSWT